MQPMIHTLVCKNFSEALETITQARASGLKAAYLPHGGIDAHRDDPIIHRVPLMGPQAKINQFLKGE